MCVHAGTCGVKFSADIPEHRPLSSIISFKDLSTLDELIEYAAVWSGDILLMSDTLLSHVLFCSSGVDFRPRHIEISGEDHSLAHGGKVADPRVEGTDEAVTEIVAQAIAVRRAVYAEEYEGWELKYHAPPFGIQSSRVDSKLSDLRGSGISANALIFW